MTTRFVAEVCSNHHGDLDRCLRFIDTAADMGCDAVKFQQFRIRELFAPEALRDPVIAAREAWELPEHFNVDLARRCRERGLLFSNTPFYMDAVELLEPHVDFFKLASYQVLWTDILREVGRTGKPVALATGMATLDETRAAVETLREAGCGELTLLHCVSLYPTQPAQANLAVIDTLRREFGCDVGWSDHTANGDVVRRAVRRWDAAMVEFHMDLDGEGEEYGGGHCWLPGEMAAVIADVRSSSTPVAGVQACDGDGEKTLTDEEREESRWRTDPSDGLRPLKHARVDDTTAVPGQGAAA